MIQAGVERASAMRASTSRLVDKELDDDSCIGVAAGQVTGVLILVTIVGLAIRDHRERSAIGSRL